MIDLYFYRTLVFLKQGYGFQPIIWWAKKKLRRFPFKCSVKTNPIGSLSLGISSFSGKKTDGIEY
ncbi:MAG: hypothetical protein FJZ75_02025 [Bacteroidetes bacterium]|nr:hypothetical protein [Bacteroidota bacterium]